MERKRISDLIEEETEARIRAHRQTRRPSWNPVKSLTDLSLEIAHEYEDRFLVELVQNGYDAHPVESRDGQIHILLDESRGDHGVLYVANGGKPFTRQNFEALSNVARSSKPPGEGIGNKGLGFRSILQICDWPEIYSLDPEGGGIEFDGYCFGFAHDEDLRRLTEDDDEFSVVSRDFSRHLLPVPRLPVDDRLIQLRQKGAVTVVRLPLKSELAREKAVDQIDGLGSAEIPTLLFLERLRSMTLERVGGPEGADSVVSIDRIEKPLNVDSGTRDIRFTQVETGGGRFLVATRKVLREKVLEVIEGSISEGQLSAHWRNWDGDAQVALAVPLDEYHEHPFLLYTYLPMRTKSPLAGHLNAPFYTKLARTELNEDVALNSYFFNMAAETSIEAALALVRSKQVPESVREGAVIDLLTWEGAQIERLLRAFRRRDIEAAKACVVPVRRDGELSWYSLSDAYRWDEGREFLSPARLGTIGVPVVDPAVGVRRLDRLDAFHCALLDRTMYPVPQEIAEWAEDIAARLGKGTSHLPDWNAFYGDLADYFGKSGRREALNGRKILLDQDHRIRRAGPWRRGEDTREPTIFFPPRRAEGRDEEGEDDVATDDEELIVPKRLQRAVCFVNEAIQLRRRDEGTIRRTEVATFFESAGLVERFNRQNILRHLQRLLKRKLADSTRQEALRWVYLQQRSVPKGLARLDQLGLYVPTAGGWRPAKEAFFSSGWESGLGKELEQLIDLTADRSSSLREITERLLLSPTDWPMPLDDLAKWQNFLAEAGVRCGIWPIAQKAPRIEQQGCSFNARSVGDRFGLHERILDAWSEHVNDVWGGYAALVGPYTPYRGQQELWVLPGQEAFEEFDDKAKRLYCILIIHSIKYWSDAHFSYVFKRFKLRHRNREDPQTWPSPLHTFIKNSAWFPMTEPRRREETCWVPLNQAWHFDDSTGETAPRFARLPPVDVRRRIDSEVEARERLITFGLRVWNRTDSAWDRLQECANLVATGAISITDTATFRKHYEAAWAELLGGHADVEGLPLVVSRGRELSVVEESPGELDAAPTTVFVSDTPQGLVGRVLEGAGLPILVASERQAAGLAPVLQRRTDLHVRVTSGVRAEVLSGSEKLQPSAEIGSLLVQNHASWLPKVVAVAIELQTSRFVTVTERVLYDALSALRRVRLVRSASVFVRVDDELVPTPPPFEHCIPIADDEYPLLVSITGDEHSFGWQELERVAESLTELIGHPSAGPSLRLAAFALDNSLGGRWQAPEPSDLARVFNVSVDRIDEIIAGLRAENQQLAYLIAPVIALRGDLSLATELEEAQLMDRQALVELIGRMLGSITAGEDIVSAAERAQGLDELRRELQIPLGPLNGILRQLRRPPLHFPEEHQSAFRNFVNRQRERILALLREAFVDIFKQFGDLDRYVELRTFPGLEPPTAWLEDFDTPADHLMEEALQQWLADNGLAAEPSGTLPLIDEVRTENQAILGELLPQLCHCVLAWCARRGRTSHPSWLQRDEVLTKLRSAGCLDFVPLCEEKVIRWVDALELWPAEMPLTADRATLQITDDDLENGRQQEQKEREAKERERRSIRLDGRQFRADPGHYQNLVRVVRESLDHRFLTRAKRLRALLRFAPAPEKGKGTSGVSAGGTSYRGRSRDALTEVQREAIGLIGEVLAFEWLNSNYPDTNADSWVSSYRNDVIGGHSGDDSLGYDFRVVQRSRTLLFEVKATRSDECEFALGESELRAARAARKGCYRIIFIQNVLDSADRDLFVLPNPLEQDHRKKFQQVNEGVRLRFVLGEGP